MRGFFFNLPFLLPTVTTFHGSCWCSCWMRNKKADDKKSRDKDTKKMDFETQAFSYTMEDSWKSSLWQWTANNEGEKIPRSLCIFEMTYGCEILRQRMRQSNFSMPTWKTLNWTDLHHWHLVNVLSKKLLVQFHLRSSIMHDWSPVWGEFWFMARNIFLDMSIYWQNAHVSEHDTINSMSKGLKLLTSVELQHRVKFKGNWVVHLTIFGTVPRLDSRQKLEEEQHPEVLAKKF